ncbi:hypothetical protein ACHAPJ_002815 [Fusarium lateritium]
MTDNQDPSDDGVPKKDTTPIKDEPSSKDEFSSKDGNSSSDTTVHHVETSSNVMTQSNNENSNNGQTSNQNESPSPKLLAMRTALFPHISDVHFEQIKQIDLPSQYYWICVLAWMLSAAKIFNTTFDGTNKADEWFI